MCVCLSRIGVRWHFHRLLDPSEMCPPKRTKKERAKIEKTKEAKQDSTKAEIEKRKEAKQVE